MNFSQNILGLGDSREIKKANNPPGAVRFFYARKMNDIT
jgi:hypothetical protein